MAKIPAITAIYEPPPGTIIDQNDPWHAPGQSRGLVERVRETAGGYVGPQLSPGTIQEREIVSEKVASGPRDVVFPWFLPYFDSATLHESEAMRLAYRQMLASPAVKSALLGKLFGVAGLDLKILPPDKKNPRDKAIAKHVEWMLTERLHDGVPGLIWSVLSGALIDGYSVNEKVWALEDRGRYAGKYSLGKLKPKDTNNDLVLQTDEYRNVIGILGMRYNGGREFSPANFLIYRHLPLYDNPTGMSDLRAAYAAFWMLDTITKLRAINCEKYAIPMLMGTYQNTTVKSSLESALKMAKSQRWLSVPESCKVTVLEMAGTSEEHFRSFRNDLLHDIYLGIQYAILQSLEGDTTEGRGNSQVHESTSDKVVWFLANSVESLLNDRDCGLIKDCVDLNYVTAEYPKASLSAVDVNELAQEIQVDTALHALGLDLSKDEIYERYGRTPPEDDDDVLPGQAPQGPPGGAPGALPGPGDNGGTPSLPFMDQDIFTPSEKVLPPAEVGGARPFRGQRFSEQWRRYLSATG